jgi:hypothetical protein
MWGKNLKFVSPVQFLRGWVAGRDYTTNSFSDSVIRMAVLLLEHLLNKECTVCC